MTTAPLRTRPELCERLIEDRAAAKRPGAAFHDHAVPCNGVATHRRAATPSP